MHEEIKKLEKWHLCYFQNIAHIFFNISLELNQTSYLKSIHTSSGVITPVSLNFDSCK